MSAADPTNTSSKAVTTGGGGEEAAMAGGAKAKAMTDANPRGIPRAPFISSVETFLGGADADVDEPLKSLQEMLAKYRFMEQSNQTRKKSFDEKGPELERTIKVIEELIERKKAQESLQTTFELADTLYARAEIPNENLDEVYLWLGASTLLSYPPSEALSLLQSKLSSLQVSLQNVKDDLDFLREQITTTEVNVARVYNWDVGRRRKRRLEKGESVEGEEEK